MLRKHGLEDRRELTIIEAELPQQRAMLESHKVDLTSMTELGFVKKIEVRKYADLSYVEAAAQRLK
jgi:hypothetical protein